MSTYVQPTIENNGMLNNSWHLSRPLWTWNVKISFKPSRVISQIKGYEKTYQMVLKYSKKSKVILNLYPKMCKYISEKRAQNTSKNIAIAQICLNMFSHWHTNFKWALAPISLQISIVSYGIQKKTMRSVTFHKFFKTVKPFLFNIYLPFANKRFLVMV